MTVGNAAVEIEVSAPMLRPGLTIRCSVSEKYAANAASAMIELARSINAQTKKENKP